MLLDEFEKKNFQRSNGCSQIPVIGIKDKSRIWGI